MPKMAIVWILIFVAVGMAQEPAPVPEEEPIPIPIPVQDDEETRSIGGQTFVDDVFQGLRNRWGFSLSAYQAYTTDVSGSSERNNGSGISAFSPSTFINLGRRRSRFHADVGAGYRMYNGNRDLNSWDYFGNAEYTYDLSRRTSFRLSDQFTSSFNDSWSFVSMSSPINYSSGFSNEVLFNRQRITRNALQADLSSQLTRSARAGVFGGYNVYRYPQTTLRNADAFEVGGSFEYRLTRWLTLTNRYTTYLNDVDEELRDTRIHRLQVGNLDFDLSRSWRVWLGGGAELAEHQGENRVGENVDAGIGYTSLRTMMSVTYQRGFTSGIGLSRLMTSDIISGNFGYRATRWLSANLQSYYYRNMELDAEGVLETISGGGGLQFLLRRDLVANVNAFYQHQSTRDFSIQGLGLDRVTAYVGLQYVWPAMPNR